ncbi:DUF2510 domain-containing protein [Solirubrobacter ginsenosidimutans]|uniref:DUF2510 domain-containing protein n=1 Tax=Solirubrobacter ginsenosidimutans TaxID=490573 RepID=A0A9X3S4H9_9ACTN|nr:DUF2510 domain-containing protein [Solirubrobacter ginsenosidimutans]MDA0166725.1 DUF2510 domain-containing protein [Solirubrobacter ginsenosidimutans]
MTDGSRRWITIGTLALTGAAAGGVTGSVVAPEVTGVVASLALAGFGLGGIVGTLFAGGWRSSPDPTATTPDSHPEPGPLSKPEAPRPAALAESRTPPDTPAKPEAPPAAVPEPPPLEDAEPGWYPLADGTRRYWDGSAWTDHVWRERAASGTRRPAKPRRRGRSL